MISRSIRSVARACAPAPGSADSGAVSTFYTCILYHGVSDRHWFSVCYRVKTVERSGTLERHYVRVVEKFQRLGGLAGRTPERTHYRSEEHTSELQSLRHLVCRLLLEKKKK